MFPDKHGWITPAVASDGRDFLIVWAYAKHGLNRDIYAARVSAEGELLDHAPIVVSRARKTKAEPTVVWTGRHYFVAWEDYRNSEKHAGRVGDGEINANADIYGARIRASGDVLDSGGFLLAGGERNEATPQLAVSSGEVALAWSRDCGYETTPGCTHDVFAAPLGLAGRNSGPPLALGTRSGHETLPALTATPNGYLAAWTDWERKSSSLRIRGIGADWDLQETTSLDTSDKFEYSPHLHWTGDQVLLSWIRESPCIRCGGDVALLRLSQDGEPAGEPASVATDEAYEFVTDVESDGSGCAATFYACGKMTNQE